jgi:cob(I)alamin adenosyltransferase
MFAGVKIYTRRGDQGETDLFGGERVSKDDRRVAAYGEIDELNAAIGAAAAASAQDDLRLRVQRIQSTLFDIGAHLATPDPDHRSKAGVPCAHPEDVEELEGEIDRLEGELEPLRSFVLPGGTPAAAAFHLARTVCRRAERSLVALDRAESVDEVVLRYVNRLSDLLFTFARVENRRTGVADVAWVGRDR